MSHHDPITREPLAQENRYTRDGIYRQDNSTGGMTIMIVIAALVALGLVYFVASSFWATPTTTTGPATTAPTTVAPAPDAMSPAAPAEIAPPVTETLPAPVETTPPASEMAPALDDNSAPAPLNTAPTP